MAKFVINNHVNVLIGIILLFADHIFYPRIGINLFEIYDNEQKIDFLAANYRGVEQKG